MESQPTVAFWAHQSGPYAGESCERCLRRKLQCIVKIGMLSCTQCTRSKGGCSFEIAKAIGTKVGDNSISHLTPASTPNSHSTVPHPDSNTAYGLSGGSGTQQVPGLPTTSEGLNVSQIKGDNSTGYLSPESTPNSYPTVPYPDPVITYGPTDRNKLQQVIDQPTKSATWDWVGYGIVNVCCSPNWQFHMTSHSFDHDPRLCALMAAKVNFLVQQVSALPAPYESWDWIAEGTALEVSRSSTCSLDWNLHIQTFQGHNSLLCGWMAEKLGSLVQPRVQSRCNDIGMDSGANEVQKATSAL